MTTTGAACATNDPEIWFDQYQVPAAVAICQHECPVRAACAEKILELETVIVMRGAVHGGPMFALRHDVVGVAGGLTAVQRRGIIGARLRAAEQAAA